MQWKGRCHICGISGFIGQSQHPDASHQLMTALFRFCDTRGTDAAGFWGTESGDGRVLYHKEPVKSSEFVKKSIWHGVNSFDVNCLITHARGASLGAGHPYQNHNNHPFVSSDRTVGLVHNGRIPEAEYEALRKRYAVQSDCDSEMFLRIFEAPAESDELHNVKPLEDVAAQVEEDEVVAQRLRSLSNIWSQVTKGHMAVAIGERVDQDLRRLWLFRNKFRPLWIVDLRAHLGQIFFVSSPEIWQMAAQESPKMWPFLRKRTKLIEIPPEEVWVLEVSGRNPVPLNSRIRKFDVVSDGFRSVDAPTSPVAVRSAPITVPLYTRLGEKDVVQRPPEVSKKNTTTGPTTTGGVGTTYNGGYSSTTTTGGTSTGGTASDVAGVEGIRTTSTFSTTADGDVIENRNYKFSSTVHGWDDDGGTYVSSEADAAHATAKEQRRKAVADRRRDRERAENGRKSMRDGDDRTEDADWEGVDLQQIQDAEVTQLEDICSLVQNAQESLKEIEKLAIEKKMSGELDKDGTSNLITSLEQNCRDLQGTIQILEGTVSTE